jgi:hypothetical protein
VRTPNRDRIPTPRLPINLTIFGGRDERVGQRRAPTWAQLAARLRDPTGRATSHRPNQPQWTFSTFRANRRAVEGIENIYGLTLDYDGNPDLTLRDLRAAWGQWCFLGHTTVHHNREDLTTRRPAFPRWRLFIPFTRPVSAEDFEKVAEWAMSRPGPPGLLHHIADPSRVYNEPLRTDTYTYDTNHTGEPLDPGWVLRDLVALEEADKVNREREALNRSMPSLSESFGVDDLDGGRRRSLISIARLPGWPGGPKTGHGLGKHLDVQLGGGICPGYVVSVGGRGVGGATSAWIQQLLDGLALRSVLVAEGEEGGTAMRGPMTPVVMLTEAGASELTWRTLARWTGADQRLFRAGAGASRLLGVNLQQVERAFHQARASLASRLGSSRALIRVVQDMPERGRDLIEPLIERVELWRKDLVRQHQQETWPVVVFDPIEQWQDRAKPGIEGTNELVEALVQTARIRGWILVLASGTLSEDTHLGYSALTRLPDACLRLRKPEAALPGTRSEENEIEVEVLQNRWGREEPPFPRYRYQPRCSRFEPVSVGEVAAWWEDEVGDDGADHTVMRQAPPRLRPPPQNLAGPPPTGEDDTDTMVRTGQREKPRGGPPKRG